MRRALLAVAVLSVLWLGLADGSVNDLPGFSDATGPRQLSVESFERLDSGCVDAISDSAHAGSGPHGRHEYVSVIETASADADLSVWTERTSPDGADLSSFRVHVESHSDGAGVDRRATGNASADGNGTSETASAEAASETASADAAGNATCETGVQYRLVLNTSDANSAGFLPDEHGVRVLRLHDGRYAGCSAGYTGGLDGGCQYPMDPPARTWANASE